MEKLGEIDECINSIDKLCVDRSIKIKQPRSVEMSADNYTKCPKCNGKATVREDYEQGIFDDIYTVDYIGSCYECGFKFEFHFRKDLNTGEEKRWGSK